MSHQGSQTCTAPPKKKVRFSPLLDIEGIKTVAGSKRLSAALGVLAVIHITCCVLVGVAYFTPGWARTVEHTHESPTLYDVTYGLWYLCGASRLSRGVTTCGLIKNLGQVPGWWVICQVIASFLLIGCIFTGLLAIGYACARSLRKNMRWMAGLTAVSCVNVVTSGVLVALYCGMFFSHERGLYGDHVMERDIGYSLIMIVIAAILQLVSVCLGGKVTYTLIT